jgi:hypothetical protein
MEMKASSGTYQVLTYPELHWVWSQEFPLKDPFSCSGYIVEISTPGGDGTLVQKEEYTCCTCWSNRYEEKPQLSDGQPVENNQSKNVKVAEVPITSATFHEKFMIAVEQMSLSRRAYDFLKLIRAQKEGASSLFQPPSGEMRGNISPISNSQTVVGLFYATSISTKTTFINRWDVPYVLTPIDKVTLPCTAYQNSSTTKPAQWQ